MTHIDPSHIKTVRIILGIKQQDLALKSGISPSVLSKIENGYKRPAAGQMEKICQTLLHHDSDRFHRVAREVKKILCVESVRSLSEGY